MAFDQSQLRKIIEGEVALINTTANPFDRHLFRKVTLLF